jgi:hypothetical protein
MWTFFFSTFFFFFFRCFRNFLSLSFSLTLSAFIMLRKIKWKNRNNNRYRGISPELFLTHNFHSQKMRPNMSKKISVHSSLHVQVQSGVIIRRLARCMKLFSKCVNNKHSSFNFNFSYFFHFIREWVSEWKCSCIHA